MKNIIEKYKKRLIDTSLTINPYKNKKEHEFVSNAITILTGKIISESSNIIISNNEIIFDEFIFDNNNESFKLTLSKV